MNESSLRELTRDVIARDEALGALAAAAGIAVSVIHDDTSLEHAFGLRDRARGLPVTPDTLFEIGSLTKAFTAAALLLGGADPERSINAERPLLPTADETTTRALTVADVLSHRSGISGNDLLWYLGRTEQAPSIASLVRTLPIVPDAFRKAFVYNNLLYAALGDLSEPLVGGTREALVRDALLAPHGLARTSLRFVGGEDVALPYVGHEEVPRANTARVAAAGAMVSSASDLTRWMAAWLGTRIDARVAATMTTPHIARADPPPHLVLGMEWVGPQIDYGLGWFLGAFAGRRVVFHTGFIDGFSCVLAIAPEARLGVGAVSNANGSPTPGNIVHAIFGEVFNEHRTESREHLLGTYENDLFGLAELERIRGMWWLRYQGQRWPVQWTGPNAATVTVAMVGQHIPLPVGVVAGEHAELLLPLALDPRVPPARFRRTSG